VLDLYRDFDEKIKGASSFTPENKLEIRTAIFNSLKRNSHILFEDHKLSNAYEAARVNLAHKLYKHSEALEKYQNDAILKSTDWMNGKTYDKGKKAPWSNN